MSASPPSEAASDPTTSVAQRLEERAKEIFTQADVDGSGWLSHSELKRLIHANKELREELHAYGWKKFFDELDANHDGRIELAELVLYIQTHANALNSAKSSVAEPFPSLGAVAEHVAESSEAFTAPRTVSGLVAESAPVLYQFSPGWGMPSVDPECVAVQALLRFGDVEHHVVNCNNESMSPSGTLPFLRRANGALICGFDDISTFATSQSASLSSYRETHQTARATGESKRVGVSISDFLGDVERADMLAFLALVKAKLHTAAEYELWLDDQHYKEVAMPLYGGSRYPWPLSEVLCWLKRRQVAARVLKGTFDLTPEQVYEAAGSAYGALSEKLAQQAFFYGDRMTELDALVFGHVTWVLQAPLPNSRLRQLLVTRPNLVAFSVRVGSTFFGEKP